MSILILPKVFNDRTFSHKAPSAQNTETRLAAFLTADDDWIARNQGKTMFLVLAAAIVLPGVIEWMI